MMEAVKAPTILLTNHSKENCTKKPPLLQTPPTSKERPFTNAHHPSPNTPMIKTKNIFVSTLIATLRKWKNLPLHFNNPTHSHPNAQLYLPSPLTLPPTETHLLHLCVKVPHPNPHLN